MVKKALIIAGAVAGSGVAFVLVLVVLVNVRGGVGESSALAKLPLLGALIKVQAEEPVETDDAVAASQDGEQTARPMTFLRFGPEAELSRLARELEAKKTDHDALEGRLQRRERELEAWQRQMAVERDALREQLRKQKEEIAGARDALLKKEAEVRGMQVAIEQSEESNLKATADIYGRMSPAKGAEILRTMYEAGDTETVVKIIHLMQGRAAAKTLEAFPDPAVSAEITKQLQRITKSGKEGGK